MGAAERVGGVVNAAVQQLSNAWCAEGLLLVSGLWSSHVYAGFSHVFLQEPARLHMLTWSVGCAEFLQCIQ